MPRTFIAARISETRELRSLHRRLAQLSGPVRALPTGNLHVTLKFLGDTPEASVAEVTSALHRAALAGMASLATLRGMGAFPSVDRPSAVWVGLCDMGLLARLAAEIDRELAPLGFPPETRAFQPHVTVLRVNGRPPPTLFALLNELKSADFGSIEIDAIDFLQSELRPGGSRYTALAKAPLGVPGAPAS
ncbi:MAG: RNA 2',3'-cyclic phosphodiesterase [Planctomycetaceae bacterium]